MRTFVIAMIAQMAFGVVIHTIRLNLGKVPYQIEMDIATLKFAVVVEWAIVAWGLWVL